MDINKKCKFILIKIHQLCIYKNIQKDETFKSFYGFLQTLSKPVIDLQKLCNTYSDIYTSLVERYRFCNVPPYCDPWQHYIIEFILKDDNIFSRESQGRFMANNNTINYYQGVANDLKILKLIYDFNCTEMENTMKEVLARANKAKLLDSSVTDIPLMSELFAQNKNPVEDGKPSHNGNMIKAMVHSNSWHEMVAALAEYYSRWGSGIFSKYNAFRWTRSNNKGNLLPIAEYDPITFDQLVGYELQRNIIIENTKQFLKGYPANNILLYGDRGTGKSSTVKALLNMFWSEGLRLIEVPKQYLGDFAQLVKMLRYRIHKFILFVDDLSFEDQETEYRDLKAILEGGIEARPQNVLLYATSNRRHLVKEYFSDNSDRFRDEVNEGDTIQEKLSLADRFGIKVTFTTPNQTEYLNIIDNLAKRRKLSIDRKTLHTKALQWAMQHNGRSPRTAKQFIDQLEGQLLMKAK
ncbi:MAG TPA: ATP-binding protein [Clostridiales bacterium]|nr:ATP-binding protein [Clostridiales bacterium]